MGDATMGIAEYMKTVAFSCEDLRLLRGRAEELAIGGSGRWRRAYLQLADAADRLGAMIGETTCKCGFAGE